MFIVFSRVKIQTMSKRPDCFRCEIIGLRTSAESTAHLPTKYSLIDFTHLMSVPMHKAPETETIET